MRRARIRRAPVLAMVLVLAGAVARLGPQQATAAMVPIGDGWVIGETTGA
jgi:hypothetical protein